MTTRAAVALALAAIGCEVDAADIPPTATAHPTPLGPTAAPSTAAPDKAALPAARDAAPLSACSAPSLAASGPLDARDEAALATCVRPSTGHGRAARRCGQDEAAPPLDHQRLAAAVRPFDAATAARVRELAAVGRSRGRKANVFGLVGDSMTVSGAFLRRPPSVLAPELAATLHDEGGGSIIDVYAGVDAVKLRGRVTDSFGAPRAAKVGARTVWALTGGERSPLATMVEQLSPAVAIVLFGGNDAAFTSHQPVAELAAQFERELEAVVDALEARGVIPVLNTLARHGSAPGLDDCGPPRQLTNWRIAVQTNALSARVVALACRRHLPLIDVRDALDTAVNLGLGPDQIHPSAYEPGADILDAKGLRCGYNVRNYVTLLMLKQLHGLLGAPADAQAPGNRNATQ